MRVAWADRSQGEANGYAVVGSRMRSALARAGAELVTDRWDTCVAVSLPEAAWFTGEKQPALVWHTMIEVDDLPPGWAERLNQCGLVWVPSTWVQELFREHGVTATMAVVGYGVDSDLFHAEYRPKRAGPMRFGVWGDALHTRKHVELGVETWLAANVADALLEVKITDKTAGPCWVDRNGRELPDVRVFRGPWPRERLADWLRSLDCLIYLSGGEGFGLMPLEAMACGVAVVCACNTGMTDYLTDFNALTVRKHTLEPAPTYTARFGPEFKPQQLLPDFNEAVTAIRWAGEHRDNGLRVIGRQAAVEAAAWTWDQAGRDLYDLLVNHMGATA